MDMFRHGNENTLLSDKMLRWATSLFLKTDVIALPGQVADEIRTQFAVPQVGIKVWDVAPAFAHADFAQGVSDDAKLFASSLMEPFCGVNTGFEAVRWLEDSQAAVSLALLPLRVGPAGNVSPAFGMLVLASPDAQRFNSGMGTDFLQHIADWVHPIPASCPTLRAYRTRLLGRPSFARAVNEARPFRPLFPLGAPDRD